ncbi:MAG: ABC transporter permease [Cyanobacteriota bacterium]|nr:ABC transporter permease [Cyanobacteriota bacterium]
MLSLKDLTVLSCKSLIANKVRSALTTLGVFMGVGAVNATLQVGDISRAILAQQLAERGTPRVQIFAGYNEGINLNLEDMNYLRRSINNITAISGINFISYGDKKVFYQAQEAEPRISAVTQDYLQTTEIKLLKGRFFNSQDFLQYRPVIVIDKFLADKFFKNQNPLGKQLLTDGRLYDVVGIIETKMDFGSEPTGKILLPFSRYTATTGIESVRLISIRPRNTEKMEELKTIAQELLQKRLPGVELYAYSNIEDIIETQKVLEIASAGLTFVGMISLLIGGVGITNITIAAVIERTAEIGLRRAIGATKYEILCQFIIEAAILSLVGGITAITTIHGVTTVVAQVFSLPYEFKVKTVSFSLGSAVLVGVGAALFPSLRASQLDPVKALRQS